MSERGRLATEAFHDSTAQTGSMEAYQYGGPLLVTDIPHGSLDSQFIDFEFGCGEWMAGSKSRCAA